MKKIILSTLLLVGAIAIFSGCTKKSSSSSTSYSLVATIGSSSFSTSNVNSSLNNISGSYNYGFGGATSTYATLSMYIIQSTPLAPGTYPFNTSGTTLLYGASATSSPLSAIHGSIIISSVTPNLVGTFTCTLSDSTTITGGSFTIKAP